MLGNDVVDLEDPETRPETFRPRFETRVFDAVERRAIAHDPSPHARRWAHWAGKEAAYKLARQIDDRFVFSPGRLVVRFGDRGEGVSGARCRGERQTRRTLMQRMRQIRCSFVLGNDPALLTSLVSHMQDLLHQMEVLPENERLRVGVALEEALLNASYHGNLEVSSSLREEDHAAYYELARERSGCPPYSERNIYVDAELSQEVVQYVIRDEGPGFDPGELPDPTDPAYLDRPCGRGLLLMRTFMDDVEYNPLGNEVTLVKYGCDRAVLAVAN